MQISSFNPPSAHKWEKRSPQPGPEIAKQADGGDRLTDAAWTFADNILGSTLSYGIGGGSLQGTVTTSMVMNGLGGAVGGYISGTAHPEGSGTYSLTGAAGDLLGGALDGALKGLVTVGLTQVFGGGLMGAAGAGAVLGLSQVVGGMLLREIG